MQVAMIAAMPAEPGVLPIVIRLDVLSGDVRRLVDEVNAEASVNVVPVAFTDGSEGAFCPVFG